MTTYKKLTNRGVSSLATTIDDSELVISVQSGDGALFPSTYPFHVSVGAEIMSCTGRATDALTVTRGVEGTSGAAALDGAVVSLNITAGVIDTITDALATAEAAVATLITELNTAEAAIVTLEAVTPLLADGSEDLAGAWDMNNQAVTNIDIDSGAIDGAIIGGADPAAAEVTTLVVGDTLSYKGLLPITDPGSGGAIPVTVSGVVPIVTGGAETRTLADPLAAGQEIIIGLKTYVDDCVITSASPVNQTGNTILTGAAVGAYIHLVAIEDGADIEWRVVANDGWALS